MTNPGPAAIHADMTEQIISAAKSIRDPVSRIDAINDTLANNQGLSSRLGALTRATAYEMREERSYSYGEMAAELGISRSRVQELVDEHARHVNDDSSILRVFLVDGRGWAKWMDIAAGSHTNPPLTLGHASIPQDARVQSGTYHLTSEQREGRWVYRLAVATDDERGR